MIISENDLRRIVRNILLEYIDDPAWEAHADAIDNTDSTNKKKGIKLRSELGTIVKDFNSRRKKGVKIRYGISGGEKITFKEIDEKELKKDYSLWKSYYDKLKNKQFSLNTDGNSPGEPTRGLVIRLEDKL